MKGSGELVILQLFSNKLASLKDALAQKYESLTGKILLAHLKMDTNQFCQKDNVSCADLIVWACCALKCFDIYFMIYVTSIPLKAKGHIMYIEDKVYGTNIMMMMMSRWTVSSFQPLGRLAVMLQSF